MSNFEAKHPRAIDGKFTEKRRKEAGMILDSSKAEWERAAGDARKLGVPRAAFNAWVKYKGITNPEDASRISESYFGHYDSWEDFAENYADADQLSGHFDYPRFAKDLRVNCQVEETADGVTIQNLEDGVKTKASSFFSYAQDVAWKTIIQPEDMTELKRFCNFDAFADDLQDDFYEVTAKDGSIYIFDAN